VSATGIAGLGEEARAGAEEGFPRPAPVITTGEPSLLKELWQYRELLYFMAWRDVKVRYKQAALGAGWAVIQPLFTMIIFTLFFGKLAGISSDGAPYPLFAYCALLPWTYFAAVLGQGGQSLVNNSNLITKVYFPRMILPAAAAVSGLLDLAISSLFLVVMMAWYQVVPGWSILLAPAALLNLFLLTLGACLFTSALNVRYRDIKYALPFAIQLLLFLTPVIYPTTLIPERFRWLAALNPLSGIVNGFRGCVLGKMPDLTMTAISFGATLVVLAIGVAYFRKTEQYFADII
jgi:lipopolysaccharide transport system permease protein